MVYDHLGVLTYGDILAPEFFLLMQWWGFPKLHKSIKKVCLFKKPWMLGIEYIWYSAFTFVFILLLKAIYVIFDDCLLVKEYMIFCIYFVFILLFMAIYVIFDVCVQVKASNCSNDLSRYSYYGIYIFMLYTANWFESGWFISKLGSQWKNTWQRPELPQTTQTNFTEGTEWKCHSGMCSQSSTHTILCP